MAQLRNAHIAELAIPRVQFRFMPGRLSEINTDWTNE